MSNLIHGRGTLATRPNLVSRPGIEGEQVGDAYSLSCHDVFKSYSSTGGLGPSWRVVRNR